MEAAHRYVSIHSPRPLHTTTVSRIIVALLVCELLLLAPASSSRCDTAPINQLTAPRLHLPEPDLNHATTNIFSSRPCSSFSIFSRLRISSSINTLYPASSTQYRPARYTESIVQDDYYGESTRFQVEIQPSGLYSLSSRLYEHLLVCVHAGLLWWNKRARLASQLCSASASASC